MKNIKKIIPLFTISLFFFLVTKTVVAAGWDYTAWSDHGVGYAAPASGNAYYPSAIYDINGFGGGVSKYAMWYSDGDGGVFLIQSIDGVSWGAPTTMTGLVNASHVQVLYDANCFGVMPCSGATTKYKIWFWNMGASLYSISSMATAESSDGINWTNQQPITQNASAQLVIDPYVGAGWNSGTYGPVNLFYQPSAINTGIEPWDYKYVMYYDGTDGNHEYTGLAYSVDGLNWSAYTANPVLSASLVGGSEGWNCVSAVYGTVYKDLLGYHFFFSGNGKDDGAGGCAASGSFTGIGYALSIDGKTWVKDTDTIFHINDGVAYRNKRIYTPSVINDGSGILRMYFSVVDSIGGPKKIAYATFIQPAFLNVVTAVAGGTATLSDFNVYLKSSGVDVSGSPAVGTGAPGILYSLSADTYAVSEDINTSYAQSFSGDCNSSGSITISAGAEKTCTITNTIVSSPGTGGGNISAPSGGSLVAPTSVEFSGRAYPGGKVRVFRRGVIENIYKNTDAPDMEIAVADDGSFSKTFVAILQSDYLFTIEGQDKDGRRSGILGFTIDLASLNFLKAENIFLPPTIGFDSNVVTKGQDMKVIGYATPGSEVEFMVDNVLKFNTSTNDSGYYELSFNTQRFTAKTHFLSARQIDKKGIKSEFSSLKNFTVSALTFPKADFNGDGRVDISDWSIFLSRWKSIDLNLRANLDLNGDNKVDFVDFSIFLKAFRVYNNK